MSELTEEFRIGGVVHRLDEQIGQRVDFLFLNGRRGSFGGRHRLRFGGCRSGDGRAATVRSGAGGAAAVRRIR